MMTSDDDDLFEQEMADVIPLRRENRVPRSKASNGKPDTALQHRRRAAVTDLLVDRNSLSTSDIAPLDPWYVVSFKRPGVQHGVFRKLKQGRYDMQARLDLHRMNVERARREVFEFIEEAYKQGLRGVLIIHGKGQSKSQRQQCAQLKGCVDHWLRELAPVMAFHSAQPNQGGTGALYVLLRKSEEKKRENRERFSRGRDSGEPGKG
ncbi:MAG: DNA endonuclease SmrA [Pseudomonadota bacterium]